MKTLLIGLLVLFLSAQAFASGPDWMLGSSLNNAVVYVQSGADVIQAGATTISVLSRTTSQPKTFYLDLIDLEAAYAAPSATAGFLGVCYLQIPSGTDVMQWNFVNSTNSQVDRHFFQLPHAMAVPTSFAISCVPKGATSTFWNINYSGVEY